MMFELACEKGLYGPFKNMAEIGYMVRKLGLTDDWEVSLIWT